MCPDNQLLRLLHAADTAASPPSPHTDLPAQVRQRYARQQRTARQWKIGIAGTAMLVVIIAASISLHQPPVPPGDAAPMDADIATNPRANSPIPAANPLSPAEIAQLRAQADALGAQADMLEKQLNLARQEQAHQDLRDEYRRQLAINAHADTEESPIDRAAAVALGNGDYYWQVQQDRGPAQAAYQSVLDNFPHSHWAEVAKERLSQFQMN